MIDTYRGTLRVRKWPKKRPGPLHPNQQFWVDWFRQANILAKYAAAPDIISARRMTDGTPLMPRDVQLMAMRGRLFYLTATDGRKIYSVAARDDVSESLDTLSQIPGSILARSSSLWVPILPGPSGTVLTSTGEGNLPVWAPGGGGGSPYTPPTLGMFPEWMNQLTSVVEQSPFGPLVFYRPVPPEQDTISGRIRPLKPTPYSYTMGVRALTPDVNGYSAGLYLYDSVNGSAIRYHIRRDTSLDTWHLSIDYYPDPNTFGATIERQPISPIDAIYLRIHRTNDQFIFLYSIEPTLWQPYISIPLNEPLENPDHIGLGVANGGLSVIPCYGSFFHYAEAPLP